MYNTRTEKKKDDVVVFFHNNIIPGEWYALIGSTVRI